MFQIISTITHSFVNLLFPSRNHEKIIESITLADILKLPRPHKNDSGIYSLFSYKDPRVQALIWELKYHRNTKVVELLSTVLSDFIIEELSDTILFEKAETALLVAIPMSPQHRRNRGFSQTDLLCQAILKKTPLTMAYDPLALIKIKETKKQTQMLQRDKRIENISQAFLANPQYVKGKSIIVIDDVTTTGATLREAFRTLREAGARKITAFTIAH